MEQNLLLSLLFYFKRDRISSILPRLSRVNSYRLWSVLRRFQQFLTIVVVTPNSTNSLISRRSFFEPVNAYTSQQYKKHVYFY